MKRPASQSWHQAKTEAEKRSMLSPGDNEIERTNIAVAKSIMLDEKQS